MSDDQMEHAPNQTEAPTPETVERLRNSKAETAKRVRDQAHQAGKDYASQKADYSELKRLSGSDHSFASAYDLLRSMRGEPDAYDLRDFLECSALDGLIVDDEQAAIDGFVDGCLEVWNSLPDDL